MVVVMLNSSLPSGVSEQSSRWIFGGTLPAAPIFFDFSFHCSVESRTGGRAMHSHDPAPSAGPFSREKRQDEYQGSALGC